MNATHEYSDARLHYEREAGLLVCHCARPIPEPLPMWGAEQCARCGRKVLP